jgi:hypothetical protein
MEENELESFSSSSPFLPLPAPATAGRDCSRVRWSRASTLMSPRLEQVHVFMPVSSLPFTLPIPCLVTVAWRE